MSEERVDIIPDVPTFKEQGYDVIMSSDRGFSAPAGTPSEIINKMAKAVEDTLNNPEFIEKAEKLNLLIKFMGPEEYKEYLYEYRDNLQKIYDSNPW